MNQVKSGYERRHRKVLSWRRKAVSDWAAVTSPGSSFHSFSAATGKARPPMVASAVSGGPKARHLRMTIGDGELVTAVTQYPRDEGLAFHQLISPNVDGCTDLNV
jgi:hypothetical protein